LLPAARSPRATSATGWMVPSSLFTSITATTAVSGVTAARSRSTATQPSFSGGTSVSVNPRPPRSWTLRSTAGCSMEVATRCRPRAAPAAPRIPSASASVPPLVKITSAGCARSTAATSARAASSARAAAAPGPCSEEGLACSSIARTSASVTSGRAGVEAALSR
jgi:hypothetical protein